MQLDRLAEESLPFLNRYRLENKLSESLTLVDVTAVEYYSVLYGSQRPGLSASIGRVLDVVYARQWPDLVSDAERLDVYRRKAVLFDGLGIIGVCNNYLHRLDSSAPIHPPSGTQSTTAKAAEPRLDLGAYLDAMAAGEIPREPPGFPLDRSSYRTIVDAVLATEDPAEIMGLLQLLIERQSLEMVPELFRIIDNPTVIHRGEISRHDVNMNYHGISFEVTVSDVVVSLLERTYAYEFPWPKDPETGTAFVSASYTGWASYRNRGATAPRWIALWRSQGEDFRAWGDRFLADQRAALSAAESVTADQVNKVLPLLVGREDGIEEWLAYVARLAPGTALSDLITDVPLEPKQLAAFGKLRITPESLENLISHVDVSPPEPILDFLSRTVGALPAGQRGHTWYKLVWNTDLFQWLGDGGPQRDDLRRTIHEDLTTYARTIRNDSFKATHTARFIFELENLDATFEQRLERVRRIEDEGVRKEYLEVLLEELEADQVLLAIDHLPLLLEAGEWKVQSAFEERLGIPLLDFDPAWIGHIRSTYQSLGPVAFFRALATHFEPRLIDAQGDLDACRAISVLSFDIAEGFVGSGTRATNVYPLIRLLEHTFDKNLGSLEMESPLRATARAWVEFLATEAGASSCVPPSRFHGAELSAELGGRH